MVALTLRNERVGSAAARRDEILYRVGVKSSTSRVVHVRVIYDIAHGARIRIVRARSRVLSITERYN